MKKLFLLALLPAFALAGCNGISKVDYAKFKEKVDKVTEKDVEVNEVSIKGKFNGNEVKFKAPVAKTLSDAAKLVLDYTANEQAAYTFVMTNASPAAFTIAESSDLTYYTGMGFKVKSEKATYEWNGKGLLASYKAEDSKLSVSWKK